MEFPPLQVECNSCEGTGKYELSGDECDQCDGFGYVLTEFGEEVLTLVRQRLAITVRRRESER